MYEASLEDVKNIKRADESPSQDEYSSPGIHRGILCSTLTKLVEGSDERLGESPSRILIAPQAPAQINPLASADVQSVRNAETSGAPEKDSST